jgi:hypothetical protein
MRFVTALIALLAPFAAFAQSAPCLLCATTPEAAKEDKPRRPLQIDIETALDFSRVAQTGHGGEVGVDAATGARRVAGGLADLGGMALRGTVMLRGEPYAPVLINLPNRVMLRSSTGGTAEVVDLRTDVSAMPVLNGNGELRFSFGGRLIVKGQISGTLRGSIPISADYP